MDISIFDTGSGEVVSINGPKDQLESAGEKISSVHCALSRLEGGNLYITYGVNSFKDATGLNPLRKVSRSYTYALDSSIPTVVDFNESISSVAGTTAGPVVGTYDGIETYTYGRYDVDKQSPTWTKKSTFLPYDSDSASFTLGDSWGARRVLLAKTGEELLSYCHFPGVSAGSKIAIFFEHQCEAPPHAEPRRIVLYDQENSKSIGTFSGDEGVLASTDLISDDYVAFFDKHEPSLLVIDRNTGERIVVKSGEEAEALNLSQVYIFEDRLYLVTNSGTTSVVTLPDGKTVANDFRTRPAERLFGWTRVIRAEGPGDYEEELVRDVQGEYPGPWE